MTNTIHDEAGLDTLDPAATNAVDATHFRRIIAANEHLADAEAELGKAVARSRAAGNSWTIIGAALGITKQAAQQRFGR